MKYKRASLLLLSALTLLSGCRKIDEEIPETETTAVSGDFTQTQSVQVADYLYNTLTDEEKEYYRIIRTAAEEHKEYAEFPEKIEPNELRKLYVTVYNTCWYDYWLSSLFYRPEYASKQLQLGYRFDEEQCSSISAEIDSKVNGIMAGLPDDASDYDKLLYFHDYLVLNCTFSANTEYCNTIYGALVDGKAQCEGYAFAYNYLCRQAGLDCMTVWGTNSDGATHAWNIVSLDGITYHIDCTWDDPVLNDYTPDFLRHYYFLVRDSDILGTTHFLDTRYFSWPVCVAGDNFYKRQGLYCTSAEDSPDLMTTACTEAVRKGAKSFGIRFADQNAYENSQTLLFKPGKMRSIISDGCRNAGAEGEISGIRSYCNDDELIIHISMNLD